MAPGAPAQSATVSPFCLAGAVDLGDTRAVSSRWPSPTKALRELSRGAKMVRVGGIGAGWRFVREEVVGNGWLRLTEGAGTDSGSARVACNLCGWAGSRFASHMAPGYLDRNAFCPRCKAYARHRGFAWLLAERLGPELDALGTRGGRRLLFAPETGLRQLLAGYVGAFEGVDIDAGRAGVDLVADAQDLPIEDGSVELVVSFHVLEHIPDDALALSEIARILTPTGRLLLCAPMAFASATTLEFGEARADLNDHWREYGTDLRERLNAAGLDGPSFRFSHELPEAEFRRLALVDEEIFWVGRSD